MAEEYNAFVALHYAAYRPPLHSIILGRVLSSENNFTVGLDIGCGTGYSAVALTNHCHQVYGIDPSPSMLDKANTHPKIIYLAGSGDSIPLQDNMVELTTFAGSLFYAKTKATIQELKRVCRKGATILVYDFEIVLEEALQCLGVTRSKGGANYDHAMNLSDVPDFCEMLVHSERINLKAATHEISHILLASQDRYNIIAEKYGTTDPFPAVVSAIVDAGQKRSILADEAKCQ